MLCAIPNISTMLIMRYSRAVEGVGSSIAMSSFTVIFIELYPEKVGTITSWSETALGLGYSIGPAIGGFLYDNGGFHLPFTVIGVSNILFAIIMMLALPKEESITTTTKEKSGGSYTSIIKIILGVRRVLQNVFSLIYILSSSRIQG